MPKDAFHSLLGEVGSMETKKDQECCHWLGLRQKLNLIVFYCCFLFCICCLLIYTHGWLIEEGETIAYYLRNKIVWWKVLQSWESVMVFLPLSFQVLPYGFSLSFLLWGHPESLNNIRFVSRSSGDDEEDMGWGDRRETTIDRTAPSSPVFQMGMRLFEERQMLWPHPSPPQSPPLAHHVLPTSFSWWRLVLTRFWGRGSFTTSFYIQYRLCGQGWEDGVSPSEII